MVRPTLSLICLSIVLFVTANTFKKAGHNICPSTDTALAQHVLVSELACAIQCSQHMSCLGFCYGNTDNNCYLFEGDITNAIANARSAIAYIMFWIDAPGFTRMGAKAYRLMPDSHSAYECRQICADLKSTIVVPKNAAEINYIRTVYTGVVFVGLNDEETEGNFVEDATGEAATYLPWHRSEPEVDTSYNCVVLSSSSFFDTHCTREDYHCICEVTLN